MRFQQKASEIRYISKRAYLHLVKVLEKCEERFCRTHRPTSRILLLRLVILQLCGPGSKQITFYTYTWMVFLKSKVLKKIIAKSATDHRVGCFSQKHPNNWSQAIYKLTPSCDQKECKNTTDPRVECSCQSNCFYVTSQVNQNLALQS